MSHGHYSMHCLHSAGHSQPDGAYSTAASSFSRPLGYPYVNSVSGSHSGNPYMSSVQAGYPNSSSLAQTRLEETGTCPEGGERGGGEGREGGGEPQRTPPKPEPQSASRSSSAKRPRRQDDQPGALEFAAAAPKQQSPWQKPASERASERASAAPASCAPARSLSLWVCVCVCPSPRPRCAPIRLGNYLLRSAINNVCN